MNNLSNYTDLSCPMGCLFLPVNREVTSRYGSQFACLILMFTQALRQRVPAKSNDILAAFTIYKFANLGRIQKCYKSKTKRNLTN